MRRIASLAVLLAACGGRHPSTEPGAVAPVPASAPAPAPAASALPAGDNVLAEVLARNRDPGRRPAARFRAGHVTPRAKPSPTRTARGFEIRFGSRAPVATPAVYDGRVYVSGGFRAAELYAFETRTGRPVWAVTLDDDGASTPACADRVCVFNTESCTLFAVDAATGAMRWSWWLGDPLTSAPTIAGGRVFTSYPAAATVDGSPRPDGASHALAAFDLQRGDVRWQLWLDSDVMSAPVAVGDFLYVSTFAGTLLKIEQATGAIRYAVRARATSAPVVQFHGDLETMYYTRRGVAEQGGAEEMIIRADHNEPQTTYQAHGKRADYLDDKVQADSTYADEGSANDEANGFGQGAPAAANAKAAAGTVGQAAVATLQAFQGSRILALGELNVNTMGDEVVATRAADGALVWSRKLAGDARRDGGFLGTAPIAAGPSVLVATLGGEVLELAPGDGKVRARYPVGARVRAQPVAVDGWIYAGTEDGRLVAIDTGKPELTGWPMWGGNAARTGVAAGP